MTQQARERDLSRRGLIAAGIGAARPRAPAIVRAQTPPAVATPASVITTAAARLQAHRGADGLWPRPRHHHHRSGVRRPHPGQYPNPAPVDRLDVAEGPAWSSVGKFMVWSDIPNNRQLRWIEDDGRVSVFRSPSNNSNGNTFDFQGRQIPAST
jgi:gluconolactonase